MFPRPALAQLGNLIGDDLFAGRVSQPSREIADALAASPESLLAALDQVAEALAASARWPLIYTGMQSWFEEDEPVDRVLTAVKARKKRLESVLDRVLPARRARWAELLAWTALAFRDAENTAWMDLALVADELRGERPLKEIPLAGFIARNTVEAFADQT